MAYDPQLVVVLKHEIAKARSYGASSSAGSMGVMSDAQYDQEVRRFKAKRNKQILQASALSGGLSGGATYALNRASKKGPRGARLGKLTAGMAGMGAAIPIGVTSLGVARQNRKLSSPATRRAVEERAVGRMRLRNG